MASQYLPIPKLVRKPAAVTGPKMTDGVWRGGHFSS